ncbi:ankyrin repeat-containing domain protein [Hypoxylon rubiginosum]|uniref:Ankyrin repeat-containing domain protein n=1 Tax=Hypoxylon rubiginosum TaxID=110542 RepID=A0ACB9Z023_9PEZI|nr:ankyrin repeat-containing domain protein [Hypoxylon rubiginosum]
MPTDTRNLFDLTSRGDVDEVDAFLSEGNEANVKDESGSTVLHLAVKNQNYEMVKLLLEYGANPNAKDNSGSTPLNYAAHGREDGIVQLLLDYWADPNNKDSTGSTPLHNVATGGSLAMAKLLLDSGADRYVQDNGGNTPLHILAARYDAIAQLLLDGSLETDNKQVATKPMLPIIINGNHLDSSTSPSEDASETNYVLIQTKARLSPSQWQGLKNANLVVLDYVSENTYLCGYQDVSLKEVHQLDPVVYVDIYREELKVEPGLRELDVNVEVDVIFHNDADSGSEDLRDRIAKTSGLDLGAIEFCGYKARLTVPGPRIAQIAAIDEVHHIEQVGVTVLC